MIGENGEKDMVAGRIRYFADMLIKENKSDDYATTHDMLKTGLVRIVSDQLGDCYVGDPWVQMEIEEVSQRWAEFYGKVNQN